MNCIGNPYKYAKCASCDCLIYCEREAVERKAKAEKERKEKKASAN